MNEATFQNAQVTPVFIKSGTFSDDEFSPRFRPAAFSLVSLGGVTYVQTVGTEVREEDGAQSDHATIADLQMRTGYGFYGPPLYLEDSDFGDGSDDTILAVHAVKNI